MKDGLRIMNESIKAIKQEVEKVVIGKERVIEQALTAIIAGGHILLEDKPGVGKTTLALAFSKAMGLEFNRVQFTPDVVPTDITGFSMYNKQTGSFEYVKGAAMCNFLLADEINRTSSKTQAALLEVMQEGKITVDGESHKVPEPFIVMATQNPIGTAGTQMLPEAQLDRFMIQLSMGYPDTEAQKAILRDRKRVDPMTKIEEVLTDSELVIMQRAAKEIYVDEKILTYITELVEKTREHKFVKLGVSPRGALAIMAMAQAAAYVNGMEYVIPQFVAENFEALCRHRLILDGKAQLSNITKEEILREILDSTKAPVLESNK